MIRPLASDNDVLRNIISANYCSGILVISDSVRNNIHQNLIFDNGTVQSLGGDPPTGQIGIDLLTPADNQFWVTPPFVTLNDPNDADGGGYDLINFPVLTETIINAGYLQLSGFARPGSLIELFLAQKDPSSFGEGCTYVKSTETGPCGFMPLIFGGSPGSISRVCGVTTPFSDSVNHCDGHALRSE